MGSPNIPILLVFIASLASKPCLAGGTFSGLGLPEYGGGFSGTSREGVLGVAYNPAAAISEETTFMLDVGIMMADYTATLYGEEPLEFSSTSPVPFVAMTMPIGERMGFGFNFGVPYGRSGGSENNQSQRFHGIDGNILIGQFDSSLAYEVNENLTIGVGAALTGISASSLVAIDTGSMLFSLFGGDTTESLIGESVMEGTRTIEDGRALGLGGNVGFRYQSDSGIAVTASFRSQVSPTIHGKVLMRPSNTFNLVLEGDLRGEMVIPMEAQYSMTLPIGPLRVTAEGSWVDWSSTSETLATVENMIIISEDALFLQVLEEYGLTDPELLGSTQSVGVNGFRDTYAFGGRVTWSNSNLEVTAGAMFAPEATPDEWVHPGNLDFQSVSYYGGLLHEAGEHFSLGYTGTFMDVQTRTITNSTASFTAPIGTAPSVPSGNGSYSLDMWRIGLTILYRL